MIKISNTLKICNNVRLEIIKTVYYVLCYTRIIMQML